METKTIVTIRRRTAIWIYGADGRVIWEGEAPSIRAGILLAIAQGISLYAADLRDADLTRADLTDADLTDANLTRANLTRANLTRANLRDAKEDLFSILEIVPHEVPGLLSAVKEGRIVGTAYEGECCCLVGTIANERHCRYDAVPGLAPNASRPAERFFLGIHKGCTPENWPLSKLAAEWIEEFLARPVMAE